MDALVQYTEGDDSPAILQSKVRQDEEVKATTSGRIETASETASQEDQSQDDFDEDVAFRLKLPEKSTAPPVSDALVVAAFSSAAPGGRRAERQPLPLTQHSVSYNPTFDQLWAPVAGPAHPFFNDGLSRGAKNHKQGVVEDTAMEPFLFDEQYNTFQAYGYGVDPASSAGTVVVGDMARQGELAGATVYNLRQLDHKLLKKRKKEQAEKERAEDGEGAVGGGLVEEEEEEDEEALNPASEAWLSRNAKSPWAGRKEVDPTSVELTEEQRKYAQSHAEKKARREARAAGAGAGTEVIPEVEAKSTFHGRQEEERDYQGRSWLAPPTDQRGRGEEQCYIPKKWVHTWSGHSKGVSCIRFFPRSGHLLLSASMDTKIKIWDVPNSGKCMRTYMGHAKAVRDATFSNDGSKFVSCGYDKKICLWDTETGQVVRTFGTGKQPIVVRLNPDDDKQNILLAGMNDKKIMQWDMNSGEITQEYDQHLGAVNTITFVDDNRRFVTSSDDKSLRVWEFGIPVVIKYISEPHMHSMPSLAVHPNKSWVAAQSLDNQILIYGAKDKFRLNKKKRFAGHTIAGYACQVGFSPDGRFVYSGDGEGRCWFWDWKSCKVFRTLKCHDGVCIGVEWHPLEQSRVATCGWDGLIKYWD